ncbi:MAG: cytochrome b/b6 domain-containing protein [Candidatus Tyrphobacter sp.]
MHPLHVRIGHWINAVTLFVLLWSGFTMFANNRQFAMIVHALPTWFWGALQLHGNASVGRAWHMGFALVMIANALWYAIAALRTASWRRLVPNARTWLRDAVGATIAELRSPRETMHRAEYNGAQKVAYTGVMVLGALMIVTGLALWFRRQLPWLIGGLGGQHVVLPAHVIIATLFLAFIAIHLVQALRAGVPTLLSMITGTTEMRPARRRRALVWSGGVLAVLFVGFSVVRFTSGPTGVPTYLQWTVERGDRQGDRR